MLASLAQDYSTSDGGGGAAFAVMAVVYIALIAIYLVSMWKLFTKMGQPGWQGIIPLLNAYVIFKLAGKEWWWVLLLLVPCVNIVAAWFLADSTAKLFGKETIWSVFLFIFPGIAHIILAFGSAEYVGPREQVV